VQEIAQQIAGVVAAVQAHDITRQQIEHVQQAFALISRGMREDRNPDGAVEELHKIELDLMRALPSRFIN
jgi:hypothetical protein